jgi:uncharacterized protein (DUF2141 family)
MPGRGAEGRHGGEGDMKTTFAVVLASVVAFASPVATEDTVSGKVADVTVVATHFRNNRGRAGFALFSSEEGFPDDHTKAFRRAWVDIQDSRSSVTFHEIPFGRYAITVFHDENSNGRLDKNWIGLPKEGYGVANDLAITGSPQFARAAFLLAAETMTVDIRMRYR